MNLLQAVLLLAVIALLLLYIVAIRTGAKLRADLAHLKPRLDEAQEHGDRSAGGAGRAASEVRG